MRQMAPESADFILTDPPYLVNYRDRSNRTIQNDANAAWLKPRCGKPIASLSKIVAIMFYGWTRVDAFFEAWKEAGFQPVGHLVFQKQYSSKRRFFHYQHEQAYLLAKGRPPMPKQPLSDVIAMPYSLSGAAHAKQHLLWDRPPLQELEHLQTRAVQRRSKPYGQVEPSP